MNTDTNFIEYLITGASGLGVELSLTQAQGFLVYKAMLLDWNKRMNLTAITDDHGILVKHFLDSLTAAALPPVGGLVVDVGTGAGFPGIPIKLARPDVRLCLMDATKKKLSFLDAVIKELDLRDVWTVHARAEEAGRLPEHRDSYDMAVSRAVAGLGLLAELCLPMVKPGGLFAAMKGPGADEEIKNAKAVIKALNGGETKAARLTLSAVDGEEQTRTLITIKKMGQTPGKYPRNTAELLKIHKK